MKVRILIAAAMVTGGWLAACSKPATPGAQSTGAMPSADARQIRLAEPPPSDGAVVSDLEANHALKPALVRQAEPTRDRPRHDHAAALAAEAPHVMSTTASAVAEAPPLPSLAPVPVAPAPVAPALIVGTQAGAASVPGDYQPSIPTLGGTRGPMILIRGGMGGIDDKCDLRGNHRGGIAINRSTPSFGGYPRGGIR